MATAVHEQIKRLDSDYANLEGMLGLKPLEVTLLSEGAFGAYMAQKQAEGADLAHWKPPHINPSDEVLSSLRVEVKAVSEVAVAVESETRAMAETKAGVNQ